MERKGNLLLWGQHEMAGSLVHCGVECPLFDEEGEAVATLLTQKQAGSMELQEDDRWLLLRYWTNSHHPSHQLLRIPEKDGPVETLVHINVDTSFTDISKLPVPQALRDWIVRDVFPQQGR